MLLMVNLEMSGLLTFIIHGESRDVWIINVHCESRDAWIIIIHGES
jgi:hypothetical protein